MTKRKFLRSIRIHAAVASLVVVAALAPRPALANDWLTGVGSPTQQLGAEGDLFLDLDSGRVFRKAQGTWINVGLLRAGALGWRSGSGSPTPELGYDGDMYLDITTGRTYQKTSGTWLFLADLKGAQGAPGLQGVKGDAGPPGLSGPTPGAHCMTYSDIAIPLETEVNLCEVTVPASGLHVAFGVVRLFYDQATTESGQIIACRLYIAGTMVDFFGDTWSAGLGDHRFFYPSHIAKGTQVRITCSRPNATWPGNFTAKSVRLVVMQFKP